MRASLAIAALPLVLAAPATKRDTPAPVIKPRGVSLVEGKYIVKMKKDAQTGAIENSIKTFAADADRIFNSNKFTGFAAALSDLELELMQLNPDVDYIEQDAYVSIKATQENADWGLARLSSSEPGSTTYTYDDSAGEGTCAYIIDTGIDVDHPEFEGRAEFLENATDDGENTDGNGHGTHVAGTIGSKTFGVAKKTKLFAVKVLDADGSGQNSWVIAGMDFVAQDAPNQDCPKGVVVNMSLGGGVSTAINEAAEDITDAGLFLAVAAGNEATDAEESSPASAPSACTVGATTIDDELAEYSNFGSLVDVLAPGSDIESTWLGGETNTISGTSMASPHVAGLAAYFLGLDAADATSMCEFIARNSVSDAIFGVPSSTVNLLIQNDEA